MLRNGSKSLRISSVSLLMPLVVGFAATLMQPSAAQAGDFSKTCIDEQLVIESGKVLLKANCKDSDVGFHRPSSLVISDYVANHGGNLSWSRDSKFQASCSKIHLRRVPLRPLNDSPYYVQFLHASCEDGKGGYNESKLKLNERISNQNGVLAFDGF